ncbi:hypothetical protein CIB48_g3896 [Xylaria polymorpha]|nr:hypothetical protein CIB48_g3896 [Xylaria polymorpha]
MSKGTILVTGANGGLGSAIAAQIATKPELSAYYGLYTVRDKAHIPNLVAALGNNPEHVDNSILSLDLTDLDNVRAVAKEIKASPPNIPPVALQQSYKWAQG